MLNAGVGERPAANCRLAQILGEVLAERSAKQRAAFLLSQ
jgi:hypothetical protein